MANKEILSKHLAHFDKYFKNCIFAGKAACPVVIKFCDASADGKKFSEATVDITAKAGFLLGCIQLDGTRKLLSYLEGHDRTAKIERLEKFFANGNFSNIY